MKNAIFFDPRPDLRMGIFLLIFFLPPLVYVQNYQRVILRYVYVRVPTDPPGGPRQLTSRPTYPPSAPPPPDPQKFAHSWVLLFEHAAPLGTSRRVVQCCMAPTHYIYIYVHTHTHTYVCMYVCMFVCMFCMYVCTYACMYVSACVFVCVCMLLMRRTMPYGVVRCCTAQRVVHIHMYVCVCVCVCVH